MVEQVNLITSLKYYRKAVEKPLDRKNYLKIVGGMFRFMMEKVWAGHDVELGGGQSLGTIGVRGTKPKITVEETVDPLTGKADIQIRGGKTDWGATYKLWNKKPEAKAKNERIYFVNDHSNGITYHYYWWSTGMKIGFKRLYSFKFTEDNKDMLKQLVFQGKEWLMKTKKYYDGNNKADGRQD